MAGLSYTRGRTIGKWGDASAIGELTAAAFETLEIGSHTEQFIVAALRAAGALAVSLVAEKDSKRMPFLGIPPDTTEAVDGLHQEQQATARLAISSREDAMPRPDDGRTPACLLS